MTPAEIALIEHALERLEVVSGSLELVPTTHLDRFSIGYFHERSRRVVVAVGRDMWPATLAHELGHVEQMIAGEYAAAWPWHVFGEHLARRPTKPRRLLSAVRTMQRCEHDAERHALALIRAFGLEVDREEYARQANGYLWKHEVARRTGFWSGAAVYALCPSRLIPLSEIGRVPPNVESVLAAPNRRAVVDLTRRKS